MDTIPDYENITELDISNRGLDKLPDDLRKYTNLKILNCSNNNLTYCNKDQLPDGLIELNCSNNYGLIHLDDLPQSLEKLICRFEDRPLIHTIQLTRLDKLPLNLTYLDCSVNDDYTFFGKIEQLDNLPPNLTYLDCTSNAIQKLEHLPPNLKILICRKMGYNRDRYTETDPDDENDYVHTIDYDDIPRLNQLDNLPIGLEILECSENDKIIQLDNLPPGLLELDCSHCSIIQLDNLPQSLTKLNSSINKITTLDNLPYGLEYLDCSANEITQLDNLPRSIKKLYCNFNRIKTLNNMPLSVEVLRCGANPLEYEFECSLNNIKKHIKRLQKMK